MGIKRENIPWRELPHLRIEECVELSGFSRRTITQALSSGDLTTRHIAGIRVVPMSEFRRWVGDEVEAHPALSVIAEAKAERLLRKIG